MTKTDAYPPPIVDEDGFNENGEREIVIAVMGITGAGKSYFINQLSGQNVRIGHGLEACTQTVQAIRLRYQDLNVTILDSPGFNDTYRTDTDVLFDITSYLSDAYTQGFKLSGIIYLHPITHRRMEGSSRMSLVMLRKLVGEQALGNVILATTNWDGVPEEEGVTREAELLEKFWGPLIEQGARPTRYKGDRPSAVEIMNMLIGKERVVLDIQRELVDEKKTLLETAVGYALNEELLKIQAKYEHDLAMVREQMASKDEELEKVVSELEGRIGSMRQQHARLLERDSDRAREAMRQQDQIRIIRETIKQGQDELQAENRRLRTELQESGQQSEIWPVLTTVVHTAANAFFMYLNARSMPLE